MNNGRLHGMMPPARGTLETCDLRDGYADLPGARLHYVEAGAGPLVVLLHGFPEFWFAWRRQIPALAAAGFRVVAPDMRGYNLSSRPRGVAAYEIGRLATDVRDLIAERGAQRAFLVGHDWGAAVAWTTAMDHPACVERLAILNAPHPRRMIDGLKDWHQLLRSWYLFFFALPWLPERVVRARRWRLLRSSLPKAFTSEVIDRYIEAWSQPGAATAMLNYYRAALRGAPAAARRTIIPITAPTLVIWGQQDRYLGPDLAQPEPADVPNLDRVERLADCSHWVAHDAPDRVSQLLVEFFAGPAR